MTQGQEIRDNFEAQLSAHFDSLAQNDVLSNWRMRAFDHFLELGLPSAKDEMFRDIPIRKLLSKEFQLSEKCSVSVEEIKPHILPECEHSYFVMVNGFFDENLSDTTNLPDQVVVMNLAMAMKSYGVFLQNRLAKTLKEEMNPFTALNAAFQGAGIFLYLPPNTKVEVPIQILNFNKLPSSSFASPRVQIYVGKHSSLSCYQTQIGDFVSEVLFENEVVDIQVEEKAKLELHVKSFQSESTFSMKSYRASLKKSALLDLGLYQVGSVLQHTDYRIALLEEKATCNLQGLSFTEQDRESHTHVRVEHIGYDTHSSQLFKSIVSDRSKASFEGKIYVRPEAQMTRAYQLHRSLLLSEKAESISKPNLEIFADDVKASHGATTAMHDDEEFFYLRSRGLSKKDARRLLTLGFCRELLQKIPLSSFSDTIRMCFTDMLKK